MPDASKQSNESNGEVDRIEQTVRTLICHENELVNQRIGWLVQTQGLLFAALAFAWDKAPRLSYILAGVGIATSLSIGIAIYFYSRAVPSLEAWWEEHVPEQQRENRRVIGLPSRPTGLARLVRPWIALPVVFILSWVGVIFVRLATAPPPPPPLPLICHFLPC